MTQSDIEYFIGNFEMEFTLIVGDFEEIYDGYYQLGVFPSEDFQSAGIAKKRSGLADFYPINLIGLTSSGCASLCDTFYACAGVVGISDSDIIATHCVINVRYPNRLCGDCPNDTGQAHSVVLASVSYDTIYVDEVGVTRKTTWSSMGYGSVRFGVGNVGDTLTRYAVIVECQGNKWFRLVDPFLFPDTGAGSPLSHKYTQILRENTGRWEYRYDLDSINISSELETMWLNLKGDKYDFAAEIKGRESDMIGNSSNRCEITNCMYGRSGHSPLFTKTNFATRLTDYWMKTDTSNWMVEVVNDTTIEIWDVSPRP